MQKLRNNKKKVVDRRASKGRKIRCLSLPISCFAREDAFVDFSVDVLVADSALFLPAFRNHRDHFCFKACCM